MNPIGRQEKKNPTQVSYKGQRSDCFQTLPQPWRLQDNGIISMEFWEEKVMIWKHTILSQVVHLWRQEKDGCAKCTIDGLTPKHKNKAKKILEGILHMNETDQSRRLTQSWVNQDIKLQWWILKPVRPRTEPSMLFP